jgi:hypothetical protein
MLDLISEGLGNSEVVRELGRGGRGAGHETLELSLNQQLLVRHQEWKAPC